MLSLAVGATDTSLDIQIVDDEGLPVTGLVAATMPSFVMSKGTGADISISLVDLPALTGLDSPHTDGGVFERGGGVYRFDPPDTIASTAKIVRLRGEATGKRLICPPIQVGLQDALVGALEEQVDALEAAIGQLGAHGVTVTSPINSDTGRVTLVVGDDYTDESGQTLTFDIEGAPDLTGATIAFSARPQDRPNIVITGTGSVTSQSGSDASIKVEIARTQTVLGRNWASDKWWYDLQATLADGSVRTLAGPQSPCTVVLDQTQ